MQNHFNLKPDLLQPEFWISKIAQPKQLIMEQASIPRFNQQIINTLPQTVYDLTTYPNSIGKNSLNNYLTKAILPNIPLYCNHQPLSNTTRNKLYSQLNLTALKLQNETKYGFTITRSNLRSLPSNDLITSSPEDNEFDLLQQTSINPAEPVIILHQNSNQDWYFIQIYSYRGWVAATNIALANSRQEWLEYQNPSEFLTVVDSQYEIELFPNTLQVNKLRFEMGAKIALTSNSAPQPDFYKIKLPIKNSNNLLQYITLTVPSNRSLQPSYLPYNRSNIINQAFKMLGNRYGWGGIHNSVDCSSFIQNIFKTFGFKLPRNAFEQEISNGKNHSFTALNLQERFALLRSLPLGTLLYLKGHVLLYLGEEEDNYYAIHSLSTYSKTIDEGKRQLFPVFEVIVSDLNLQRTDDKSLIESLTTAKLIAL